MESTLSGKSVLNRYKTAKDNGYSISTYYVGLDSLKLHQDRVKNRVKLGGHDIDNNLIEKRFNSSKDNLYKAMEVSDQVVIYDNSDITINRSAVINNKVKLMSVHSNKEWVNDIVTNYNMDKDLKIVVQLEQPITANKGAKMANENMLNANSEIDVNSVFAAASKNFHENTLKELKDIATQLEKQGATITGMYDEPNLKINLSVKDNEFGHTAFTLETDKKTFDILVSGKQTNDEFLYKLGEPMSSMDKDLIVQQFNVERNQYVNFNQFENEQLINDNSTIDYRDYFDKNRDDVIELLNDIANSDDYEHMGYAVLYAGNNDRVKQFDTDDAVEIEGNRIRDIILDGEANKNPDNDFIFKQIYEMTNKYISHDDQDKSSAQENNDIVSNMDAKTYFESMAHDQLEKLGFKSGVEFQNTDDIYMLSLTKEGSNSEFITSLVNTPNGRDLTLTEFGEVKNEQGITNTNNVYIFNQEEIEKGQINFDTKAYILSASDINNDRSERSLIHSNDLSIIDAQKDNILNNGTNAAAVVVVDTSKDRYVLDEDLNLVDFKKNGLDSIVNDYPSFDTKFKVEKLDADKLLNDPNAKNLINDFPDSNYSKLTNLDNGNSIYIAVADKDQINKLEAANLITYDINNENLTQTDTLKHVGINFNLVTQDRIDFLKLENVTPQNSIESNLSEGLLKDGGMYVRGASLDDASKFLDKSSWEKLYNYTQEQEKTLPKNQVINETELNISKPVEQHFTERLSSIHHHYSSVLSGENVADIKKGSFVYGVDPQTFETQQYKFNEAYNLTSVTKLPLLGVSIFDKEKNDYVLSPDLQPKEVVTKPLDKVELKQLVDENLKSERMLGINHAVKEKLGFEETLPSSVKGAYIVQEHKNLLDQKTYSFYDKADTKLPAFESNKNTLETTKEDQRTISAMISVAKSQNWNSVKITGTEEFRREAWLQASLAGIEVKGYKPKENDLIELKARSELLEKNTIVGFTKEQELIKQPTTASKEQISTTEAVYTAPRAGLSATAEYSQKPVEQETKTAKDFTISGKISDYGYAPYPDNPKSNSFFVEVIKDDGTTSKAWGLALADQLTKNDLIKGDTVNLQKLDGQKTDVSLPTKVKDSEGNVSSIQEKIYTVQAWNIDVIEKVSERPAPDTDKSLSKDDHKEIEKNQYKLTEKQISFFANKLVHDDAFASKFSVAGESYQAFESRITKNLHDESKVKEYSKYLQSMGLLKDDHKANLQSDLNKLGAKPELQERILKTFDNATSTPSGARTIEQAKPQSVEITKQKSNDSKERER